MAKSSRAVDDIDEAAMLQSIFERDNLPVIQPAMQEKPVDVVSEKPKEAKELAKRKRNNVDYSSLFLVRNELNVRSCVYISKKVHATILKIVKVISNSNKDITVGGYIDSILIEHLETHKEEIIEMYNKELSKNDSNSLINF